MHVPADPTEAQAFLQVRRHPNVVYARWSEEEETLRVQFRHGPYIEVTADRRGAPVVVPELEKIERVYGPVPKDAPEHPVERIPPELWGRGHFQVFAYAWHVAHTEKAEPDREKMRCTKDNPMRTAMQQFLHSTGGDYPTVLDDDVELFGHDDWDCIEDIIAAGLLENIGSGIHPIWQLTERGVRLGSLYIRHRGEIKEMSRDRRESMWGVLLEIERETWPDTAPPVVERPSLVAVPPTSPLEN